MEKFCWLLNTFMFSCIRHSWVPAKSLYLIASTSYFPPQIEKKKACPVNGYKHFHYTVILFSCSTWTHKFKILRQAPETLIQAEHSVSGTICLLMRGCWAHRPTVAMLYYCGVPEGTIDKGSRRDAIWRVFLLKKEAFSCKENAMRPGRFPKPSESSHTKIPAKT